MAKILVTEEQFQMLMKRITEEADSYQWGFLFPFYIYQLYNNYGQRTKSTEV